MVIYKGAQVGLNPMELFDLTFSELNTYIQGLTIKARSDQEAMIREHHSLATFNGLAYNGKLKGVEHYLPRKHIMDNGYSKEKSREVSRIVDRLRGEN